jgi:uncharacterized protein
MFTSVPAFNHTYRIGLAVGLEAFFMQAISRDERTWAMLAHLCALVGYSFVPFGNIVAPLIVWLIRRDQSWFVDDQAKESLNFQISMVIYSLICIPLILLLIGIVLLIILYFSG